MVANSDAMNNPVDAGLFINAKINVVAYIPSSSRTPIIANIRFM
jgi:hypothetical protein